MPITVVDCLSQELGAWSQEPGAWSQESGARGLAMAISVILVLLAGNLFGAVIKGITGFGSAIINLCIWIACICGGINSGTLQQAVLAECICSEVVALPLLFMTRAHATCDFALVLSLSVLGAAGAPIGAAMLTYLPARQVEFAVACLMLLVIWLNCRHSNSLPASSDYDQVAGTSTSRIDALQASNHCTAAEAEVARLTAIADNDNTDPLMFVSTGKNEACSVSVELLVSDIRSVQPGSSCTVQAVPGPSSIYMLQDSTGAGGIVEPTTRQCRPTSTTSSSSSLAEDAQCICTISELVLALPATDSSLCHDGDDPVEDEQAVLLLPGSKQQQTSIQVQAFATAAEALAHGGCCDADGRARGAAWQIAITGWWSKLCQPEMRMKLLVGSLAGSVSGIMAGLTGIGGPPVMLMYERLQVPKDVVRGTNAVCGVLQFRIFAYMALGMFVREDVLLYVIVAVGSVVGMLVGCLAAAHTNQAMFSRMLTGLMVLCCLLMLASAAGLAGNKQTVVQHGAPH